MRSALLPLLCCPRDSSGLHFRDSRLLCDSGHVIPVDDGIPIFTDHARIEPTPRNMPPLPPKRGPRAVDPFVDDWIVNTNGNLYWGARGNLQRYPIPRWPEAEANPSGKTLVDLGCSWGRWSIAAARAGFVVCGVDVHLDALHAATRVARDLGIFAEFACADACNLPFKTGTIDFAFSYSVLQHMDKRKVALVLKELSRILVPSGNCLVQLPNSFGVTSAYRQARRGFREPASTTLEMRYWKRSEIAQTFRDAGFTKLTIRAEGFFVQNTQREDLDLLSAPAAAFVLMSSALRTAAGIIPPLAWIADSFWVEARKQDRVS